MITKQIDYKIAVDFLLPKHYSGRIPSISFAFGWYKDDLLCAVVTFGKPASNQLCVGVCGDKFQTNVFELNRLCRIDELDKPLSMFVSECMRILSDKNLIIVSYADTGMNHNGYIYQALNFIYTGATKSRTDKYTEGNKHSRHYKNDNQNGLRKVRTSKHRYIYFACKNKRIKKEMLNSLNYEISDDPKNENRNYKLGEYQKVEVISDKRIII